MLDKHPVETLFEHLTHIVAHKLPEPIHHEGDCDCCGRPASEFGFKAYAGIDSSRLPYIRCAACECFFVGDVEVLGVERLTKGRKGQPGNKVSHKFGMMAGSGALIESNGSVTFFTPPGTYKKLPNSFLERFSVIECSSFKQMPVVLGMNLTHPLLYVQDFGKKTYDLITGLRYSVSESAVIPCTDNGATAFSEPLNTLNLERVRRLLSLSDAMKLSEFSELQKNIERLCLGRITPKQFTEYMGKKATDEMMAIYQALPCDPHMRLRLLKLVYDLKTAS